MSSLFAFFYVVHVVLKSSDLTDQSVLAVILVSRQGITVGATTAGPFCRLF